MSDTKEMIFRRTEEARDLLRHHPLTPEQVIDLFTSIGVGAFRYSAALVPWTEKELELLEAVCVQAYKCAWGLPWTTASDVFTLPIGTAGMAYPRRNGAGIMPPPSTVPQTRMQPSSQRYGTSTSRVSSGHANRCGSLQKKWRCGTGTLR